MKRKLSIIIAICMMVTMIPAGAFAETGNVQSTDPVTVAESVQPNTSTGGATIVGGASYATLDEAIWAAQNGDTIRLDGDSLGMIVIQFKDIVIDGNGHKFVLNGQRELISIMGGNVKLTNADIVHTHTGMDISNKAVVLIEDCDFTWAADTARSVVCYNYANVNIKNCRFNENPFGGIFGEMTCVEASEYAAVNVTDSRMSGDGTGVQVTPYGDVTCSDCVISMSTGNAVEVHPNGRIYINGGYYKGQAGLSMGNKAKATIKEGWFESIYEMSGAITGAKTNVALENGSTANPENWQSSVPQQITIGVDIARPQNLKVNLSGKYNTIKASWGISSSADGYAVYYKKGNGNYKLWTRTTGTVVTMKGLAGGVKYTVKVVPYQTVKTPDGKKYFEISNVAVKSAYTLKKVSLKNFQRKNGKVNVRWYNINGESGYQISRTLKKNSTNVFATVAGAAKVNKLVKANKGKKYYYKVRAYKTVNGKKIFGPWSNVKQFTR